MINIIKNLSVKEFYFGWASLISMSVGSLFAHEYSHMIAMRVLFLDVNPYMSCDFFKASCFAHWGGNPVIRPELSITFKTADGIVDAAGPISDIIGVAFSSMIAWKTRQSNKKISLLFAAHAFTIAFNTFAYCVSTQGSNHGDFVGVESNIGIAHSIQTAITGSIALGATVLMGYLFSKRTNGSKWKKNT